MPDIGNRTVLAFDFGTKSIGVAVGQEITGTASPLAALKAGDDSTRPQICKPSTWAF